MKFELVVIGASLGGLHALRVVLGALPKNYSLPVVIVQHRKGEDILSALLATHCELPVSEAEDKEPLIGGHVYLAPSNYHLLVEAGHCALSTDEPVNYAQPSIDVLFESAADAYDDRVIGVILSGTGADGARGLAAIKRRGGLTITQDPATAEACAMPEAAIAAARVDAVLSLQEIGLFLTDAAVSKRGNDGH